LRASPRNDADKPAVNEKALLLRGVEESSALARLEKLLTFLGVECIRKTVGEFLSGHGRAHVLATPEAFSELAGELEKNNVTAEKIHSAFVFASGDPTRFTALGRQITYDPAASLIQVDEEAVWSVSAVDPRFAQSMSGLQIAETKSTETALIFDETKCKATKIISSGNATAFARFEFQSVPIFLSTADVIDVDAPLSANVFDVRTHFLSAVPAVLYVKWAFAEICWQAPDTCACLVIDDPPLRPRYGFLNFQHLLGLMERVNFCASIAFIPWNWNRSAQRTVRLFKENPKRFSISIHGCDHTGGEYGSHNRDWLAWKSTEALSRMTRHQSRTGLSHDRVMVFPQGVFSDAAMSVLKRTGFIGVVNTEALSVDAEVRPVTIADYWNVAVMNYSDFPIFTRRYPWAGEANFAFDILLGKPCIIVVHHNDCHDDCRHVVEFIDRLNRLNRHLRWTNLSDVIRRSVRQREVSPYVVEVEIFGSEARVENSSAQKKLFRFSKREAAPETVTEVRAAGQPIKWTAANRRIEFELELHPSESRTVVIAFKELSVHGVQRESLRYQVRTMVRRYLCELRDNYVTGKSFSN